MNRLPFGRVKGLLAVSGLILAIAGGISAAPPAWWSEGDPPVIDPAAEVNNHGAANVGQAKWMAKNALGAVRAVHPVTANAIEAEIVGAGNPIASWDVPVTQAQKDAQHAPLLIGQLKAIAAPFYSRLHTLDPAWLDGQLTENQTKDASDSVNFYPWSSASADDNNKAPVTIGQLKAVFSLRFETLVINEDKDYDGLPDAWEVANGLDSNDDGRINAANGSAGDLDGDGVSNSDELTGNTNPNDTADFPVRVIQITKGASGHSNTVPYDPPRDPYMGVKQSGRWWTDDGYVEAPINDHPVTPAYLAPILDGIAFPEIPPTPPQDQPWLVPQSNLALANVSCSSRVYLATGSGIDTGLTSSRVWIKAPAAPAIQKFTFVKAKHLITHVYETNTNPRTFVSAEVVELTIPANQTVSNFIDLKHIPTPVAGCDVTAYEDLLPVEVVELSPKTKDDNDNDVAGSEKPSTGTQLTPFVELNPVTDRIAHRELKVKIGEVMKGKTVTWTLEPVPGGIPASIRGQWTNSATHSDRFEASTAYGANGFSRISQASGRTTIANDGFTAIRVNVPPVAYNKVRIRIEIEGVATAIDLIDMEVPAIIVIDPGHGGDPSGPKVGGSDPEHALCPKPPAGSGSSERVMTLEFGLLLRDRLLTLRTRDHLNLRFYMTRTADVNSSLAARANIARDRGADVLISFHFNDNVPHTGPRGTETYYDSTGNFNQAEDVELAGRVNVAVFGAISAADAAAINRGVKGQGLDVLSDPSLGNNETYHPVRAVLLETEFIDVLAVDQLLNTNANHQQVRHTIIDALGDALQDDLLHNPQ